DQCGLENDGTKRVQWAGPQRIRETRESSELQAKLHGHLDRIFQKDTINGKRLVFLKIILNYIYLLYRYLKSEPMLIEDVPLGIVVVGDMHGQLHDLFRIFSQFKKDDKPGYECTKFLFLGDYVDGGKQSLEIIIALFSLKMLYPDRIFLLCGNHEFALTNVEFGFVIELNDRYEKVSLP
ncbi:hypothetical protein PMAYCL1PPCAC_27657, partial [Pristionchus mayeri]